MLYNSILGGSANSKLFQNVREKAHMAYVASSSYVRYKNNIFVLEEGLQSLDFIYMRLMIDFQHNML